MTARPFAVGDRVRSVRSPLEDQRVGVVVHIGDQSPRGYGEPYSVGVRLDDDGSYLGGSTLGYRLSELERLDDPHTSSAPLTEDPADTLATPDAVPAPEAGAASAHDAAPVRVTYADPSLTRCPGCRTCQVREAVARQRAELDPQLVAEAHRRDGGRCRYCDAVVEVTRRGVKRVKHGRVRATNYGVMLICNLCVHLRVDERHAPLPPVATTPSLRSVDIPDFKEEPPVVRDHQEQRVGCAVEAPLSRNRLVRLGRRANATPEEGEVTGYAVEPHDSRGALGVADREADGPVLIERPLEGERREFVADGERVVEDCHEVSPPGPADAGATAQRAEASVPPQRDTATVGDRSDVAGCEPRVVAAAVGGRAVPPVPAPADTTTSSAPLPEDQPAVAFPCTTAPTSEPRPPVRGTDTKIGAASAHDAAPIADLTALRDAACRLRDVRAEIDRLLDLELDLAEAVGDGLGQVVGVPVDLTWGWPTEVDA